MPLDVADDLEEIAKLQVPDWAEHAHQFLGRLVGVDAKLPESDGRIDAVTQLSAGGLREVLVDVAPVQKSYEFNTAFRYLQTEPVVANPSAIAPFDATHLLDFALSRNVLYGLHILNAGSKLFNILSDAFLHIIVLLLLCKLLQVALKAASWNCFHCRSKCWK